MVPMPRPVSGSRTSPMGPPNLIPWYLRVETKKTSEMNRYLFISEVFFVSTREYQGIKFGGPIGDVRDPETGLGIGTMVYGDFSIRVTEPEKLVIGLTGMGRT